MRSIFTLCFFLLTLNSFSQSGMVLSGCFQCGTSHIHPSPIPGTPAEELSVKAPDLTKGLTEKVFSLNIQTVNTDTGNKGRVFLRCGRSYAGNSQPLLVLDGIPQKISALISLNPNDIDSIWILKSPESCAIYGSQGVNGAIVATTKKKSKLVIKDVPEETVVKQSEFHVYPNPVQKGASLNLQFDNIDGKEKRIRVFTLDGKLVMQQSLPAVKDNSTQSIQLSTQSGWTAGTYFIQLLYENGEVLASEKIIIQ